MLLFLIIAGIFFAFYSVSNESSAGDEENLNSEQAKKEQNNSLHSGANKNEREQKNLKAKNFGNKNNEKVVDQTSRVNENVLGAETKIIEIEIVLFDGEQNKILPNYEAKVSIAFMENSSSNNNEFKRTDSEGKFILKTKRTGQASLCVYANAFAICAVPIFVNFGKNTCKVNLLKGGSVEIHATNTEDKPIENLKVIFKDSLLNAIYEDSKLFAFVSEKGVTIMKNVPIGNLTLSFKALGYQESWPFNINVSSNNTARLEVRLQRARMLYFDLEVKVKPKTIRVLHKVLRIVSGSPEDVIEEFLAYQNQKGLFEFQFEEQIQKDLMIIVSNYAFQELAILPNVDTYRLKMLEGFNGEIKVINSTGQPVSDAKILISEGTFHIETVSDSNGKVVLANLKENMNLELIVTHFQFNDLEDKWLFDAKKQKSKVVTLNNGVGVSGKITCGGKTVMGAKVILTENKSNIKAFDFSMVFETDADGNYYFFNLENKTGKTYFIEAYHSEYGVAKSTLFTIDTKKQEFNLILKNEKSTTIKIIDNNNQPLPHKQLVYYLKADEEYSKSFETDEKGECVLNNLIHGIYYFTLEDENLMISSAAEFQIPTDTIELKAYKMKKIKIHVSLSDDTPYKGVLSIKQNDMGRIKALDVIKIDDGVYSVYIDADEMATFDLYGEAADFPVVKMGNYTANTIPEEINFKLPLSQSLKVKVEDSSNGKPVPFSLVKILNDSYLLQTLQTDEKGEIIFSNLNGVVHLNVTSEEFSNLNTTIDLSKTKEFVAKLMKGGGVKGHITIGEAFSKVSIILQPMGKSLDLDEKGNFEFLNIKPGQYTLNIKKTLKNANPDLPPNIKSIAFQISSGEINVINLDEHLK